MRNYILVVESGADIPSEIAEKYQIWIVPMHISFDGISKDDGTFPTEEIFSYYESTGRLPKTSGCTPDDFHKVFDEIHQKHPKGHILHLAYSAVTTCSFQSAYIAAEGREYVTSIDTKAATFGQAAIVISMAHFLEKNPDCPLKEVQSMAEHLCHQCRMSFFPGDILYLKAGGRLSNAAYAGAKILSLNPQIEMRDGRLVATKKYRGKMERNALRLLEDFVEEKKLGRGFLVLGFSSGLKDEIIMAVTEKAEQMGFEKIRWIQTGGAVSVHGGPAAFGICGFTEKYSN